MDILEQRQVYQVFMPDAAGRDRMKGVSFKNNGWEEKDKGMLSGFIRRTSDAPIYAKAVLGK